MTTPTTEDIPNRIPPGNTPDRPLGMDLNPQSQNSELIHQDLDSESRIKSPLKMRYSAEVEIIKKKWGDLEAMRTTLGMSQRKMSQLLMVDPSAWTRWTKYDHEAPPHIYRALSWFLTLQEKDPAAGNPYLWLQTVARPTLPQSEIREIRASLKDGLLSEAQRDLEHAYKRLRWLTLLNIGVLALLAMTAVTTWL